MKGKLIVVEGGDCVGKGTLVRDLHDTLNASGHTSVIVGTYTSTAVGREVRKIIVSTKGSMDPFARATLLCAAHRALQKEVLEPILDKGVNVIVDRMLPSTFVYQGIVEGIGDDTVEKMRKAANINIRPDAVLFLVADALTVRKRMLGRAPEGSDPMDIPDDTLNAFIRQGYIQVMNRFYQRTGKMVDANGTPEQTMASALTALTDLRLIHTLNGVVRIRGSV